MVPGMYLVTFAITLEEKCELEHNSSISQPKNKEKIFNIHNKLEFQYW